MTRLLRCRNPQCRASLGERYGADRLVVPYGAIVFPRVGGAWIGCEKCKHRWWWRGIVAREVEERAA